MIKPKWSELTKMLERDTTFGLVSNCHDRAQTVDRYLSQLLQAFADANVCTNELRSEITSLRRHIQSMLKIADAERAKRCADITRAFLEGSDPPPDQPQIEEA